METIWQTLISVLSIVFDLFNKIINWANQNPVSFWNIIAYLLLTQILSALSGIKKKLFEVSSECAELRAIVSSQTEILREIEGGTNFLPGIEGHLNAITNKYLPARNSFDSL